MRNHIFTIGHSNIDSTHLIDRFKQYNIDTIVDIRSMPYSKYSPQFNKESFEHICKINGLNYLYLGDALGGKPNDPSVISDSNKIDYSLLSQKNYFLTGINKLLTLINDHNVCLMCSEGQPDKCHRNLLLSPVLEKNGVEISHILPDGLCVSPKEQFLTKNNGQLVLF